MSGIGRGKSLILLVAVVIFTALLVVCVGVTNDLVAYADESEFLVNLSYSSTEYNGKNITAPVVVTKNGEVYEDYTLTYFANGNIVPQIKDAGEYSIKVSIADGENTYERNLTFTVTPKSLKLILGDSAEYTYTGMGYTRNVSALGTCAGDECEIITTYRGNIDVLEPGVLPVNADNYDMVFATSNPNYVIGEIEGDATLVIKKRTLYVKVNDSQVTFGEKPEFTYSIIGFVGNEDKSVIETLPVVTTSATAVGVHNVNARGAVARNYNFEYQQGHLTINDTSASGVVEGTSTTFSVSGVFAPYTSYTGYTIEGKSEEGKELVKTAREYRMLNFTSDIQLIYQLSYTHGVQVSDKVDVVFENVTLNSNDNYVIVVIDPNGVVTQITKYEYLNGTLSFKTPSLGTVMIFKDTFNMSILYIAIASVAGFILLLYIGAKMQYRTDKRLADESKKRREIREKGKYKW